MTKKDKNNQAKKKESSTKTKTKKRKFDFKDPKFLCLVGFLLLLVVSYFTIGLILTIILAVGIGAILAIARLLDKTKSKTKQRKILNITFIVILCIGIFGCLCVGGFLAYVVIKAPAFDVDNLDTKESTIIYDSDLNVITKLGTEMREKVSYDELPQVLVDAIIATEDSRFFQHNGFDAPRFLAASIKQVAGNSDAGGASTLSMQVVKNSFTTTEDSGIEGIIRKFTDIYLAIFKLEKNYTKEEIIEFYVNNHFLGGSYYGVEQASQAYFGKSVRDLNLSEASILAGMFKSPNYYRPDNNPDKAEARRSTVLYLMKRHGYITEEEEKAANAIPVSSLVNATSQTSSEFLGYIDTVVEELEEKYNVNPYVTPLLVYTNMDRAKQEGVNRIMNGIGFDWPDDVIQSGVAVIDVHSGKIQAVGAGRNKTGISQFNFATMYGSKYKRQPGSTAKPLFDYGPGMEYNNFSTYTLFDDSPYSYTGGKSIQNWDGQFMGTVTLRRALALSHNVPALKAFQQVDNKKIISFVQGLGIEPEIENGRIHEAHSLGAFNGVSPVQLGAAYAAFANGGYYYEPYTVNKIVYRETGETTEYSSEKQKAMSDSTAFMITDVLKDVSVGNIPNVTFAAKTGTTNYDEKTMSDYNLPSDAISDSWIVGYTPDTLISIWYGYQEIDSVYCSHNLPMSTQKNRLFVALGKEIFDKSNKQFTVPNSVVRVAVEMGTNPPMLASSSTPSDRITYEYFKRGTEPTETSSQYQKLDTPSNLKAAYNKSTDRVTLTWSKVNATGAKDEYGTFGYNVYFNDQLLGFTDKNTYTINKPQTPYGTYKVVATFKNYTANQSSAATFTLTAPNVEEPSEDVIESKLKISESENATVPYNVPNGTSAITVTENKKDVTNQAVISYTIVDGNGKTIQSSTLSEPGVYTITYHVEYKDYTKDHKRVVTVNN